MSLAQRLREWADRMDPPPDNIPDPVEMPDIPQDCETVSDKTEYTQTPGHPDIVFKRRRIIYSDPNEGMHEILIKDNVVAPGCGHNLVNPRDVGFVSMSSNLSVCLRCEKTFNRMRNRTRNEECICEHLVAPHELKCVIGYGHMCPDCYKEHIRFKPTKCLGLILGLFLKPLIDFDENEIEAPHDNQTTTPSHTEHYPTLQSGQGTWPRHPSSNRPHDEVDRS
jgi:hypothetical protein